jgi:hypothetical protein
MRFTIEVKNEKNYNRLMEELQGVAKEEFMLTCYTNIVLHPEVLDSENKLTQLNVLEMMIDYFKEREEYEKCSDLLSILKKIKKKK